MWLKQVHVYYSGTVQGVGFRYQAVSLARAFAVAGWVKNLPDGRVELLAEGKREELDGFLAGVEDVLGRHIRDKQEFWQDGYGTFSGFIINL